MNTESVVLTLLDDRNNNKNVPNVDNNNNNFKCTKIVKRINAHELVNNNEINAQNACDSLN